MALQTTIQQLASHFAEQLLKEIRGMSLEEIVAVSQRGGSTITAPRSFDRSAERTKATKPVKRENGRLPRRSAEQIAEAAEHIITLLKQHKGGLRAEQIQKELGLHKKELPRPIAHALSTKRVGRKGEKRATTYFAR